MTQNISITQRLLAEFKERDAERAAASHSAPDDADMLADVWALPPTEAERDQGVTPAPVAAPAPVKPRRTRSRAGKLTPRQRDVLALMADGEWHTSVELKDALGLRSKGSLTACLRNLASDGHVEDERVGAERNWYDERRYRLVPQEDREKVEAVGTTIRLWRNAHRAAGSGERTRVAALAIPDGPVETGIITSVSDTGITLTADDGREHEFVWPAVTAVIEAQR